MATDNTTSSVDVGSTDAPSLDEVKLAPGIAAQSSDEVDARKSQEAYEKAFDPKGYVERQQGQEAQSLLNAATPTPLGVPTRPPVAEALSNLGKVEPEQVAAASRALNPPGVVDVTGSSGVTSILDKLPQNTPTQAPQVVSGPVVPDAVTQAYNREMQANNAVADATRAKATADQEQFKNAEKAYADAEVKRAATKAEFDTNYNEKMNSYEQSIAEYKQAAGDKVIPGQIMANMDTSQKLQSGIFMALSAYGSALSGQENQALKVINKAIDMDIDAQKFNIENKLKGARMGVDGSQYLLSQMRLKFGDDESAVLATQAAMLQMTQQQLNSNASKFDGTTAGPKAQATNAQIEIQKQQYLQQLKQAQAQAFTLQGLQGGDVAHLNDNQLTAMESVNKGYRDRYVSGYGPAANQEQAKKFTEAAAEIQPAIASLDRIKEIAKSINKFTDLKTRAALQTEISSLVGTLRIPITGPGILTPAEREMIEKDVIGNPAAIFSMPSLQKAKLDTIYNKLVGDIARRGSLAGLPATSFKQSSKKSTFKD